VAISLQKRNNHQGTWRCLCKSLSNSDSVDEMCDNGGGRFSGREMVTGRCLCRTWEGLEGLLGDKIGGRFCWGDFGK